MDQALTSTNAQSLYQGKVYHNSGNPSLLKLVPPTAQSVLDVGCGAGDNARLLSASGIKVWGATASEAEAQIARNFCEQVWTGDLETESLPFPRDFFDVLLFSHVLEHFVHPERVLDRLSSHLKRGGIIAAAVPNMANFRCRWRLLKGDWRREDAGPFDRTHYQFWSYETFERVFKSANLEVVSKHPGQTSIPLWPLRRWLPRKAAGLLDRSVGGQFPNLFSDQVLVIARRSA